jgi:hypothetical protein
MGTTVSTELVYHGERRDRVGRVHVPVRRQRELVAQFRESGMTRQAFARREGIRYTTFCTWVKREEQAGGASRGAVVRPRRSVVRAAPRIRFAEVALPANPGRGLEVCLPDGTTLRGERVAELAALARALRA